MDDVSFSLEQDVAAKKKKYRPPDISPLDFFDNISLYDQGHSGRPVKVPCGLLNHQLDLPYESGARPPVPGHVTFHSGFSRKPCVPRQSLQWTAYVKSICGLSESHIRSYVRVRIRPKPSHVTFHENMAFLNVSLHTFLKPTVRI
jgi:hypothetical protein